MGDLISRNELMKKSFVMNGHRVVSYLDIIDAPTAFDADAVVEQLMVLHDEGYCLNEDGLECVLNKACSDCYREKVADIVRKGGKE